jgi:hypothetical protein
VKKKLVLMGVFVFCVNAMVFSFDGRLSLGFEYGNFFEKRTDGGTDIETYIGSPGVDLSGYFLWNKFGFFFNTSYLFPTTVTANIDGYDYFFQFNFIIGPAYKIEFTEKLDMTMGLGFSLGPILGKYNNNSLASFNMGIGGDIGLSYFITKYIFINIGSIFSYQFSNVTRTGTGRYETDEDGDRDEINDSAWSKDFNSVGVRPYIRIGWRIKI